MNFLWVKLGGLVPLDTGGKIRSYHIAKELAKKNKVTFFSAYAEHPNDVHKDLEKVFAKVVVCPLQMPSKQSLAGKLDYMTHLGSELPYSIRSYCTPEARTALKRLLENSQFDLILADFLHAAALLPADLKVPVVVFTHNVEALIFKRHYDVTTNPLWKWIYAREYKKMEVVERRYLQQADHVLTVSETDKKFFSEFLPAEKISVIPTGADTEFFAPGAESAEEVDSLVFTGSMDWQPNEEGILFFVDEILPLIRREIPNVTVWVVGRKPSAAIKSLADRDPLIKVTGRVDDIRPYVQKGSVYIVPLRVGSGTRLKIFEAMSMAKAVVSTTLGAEGLPVTHGQDILLADKPEDFARETVRLLRDKKERQRLGAAARRLVEERYSWTAVAQKCDQVLQGAIAGAKQDSSREASFKA